MVLFRGAMIEMLDHTADVGFELRAPTLEGFFEEARRGLLMVVFERPPEEGRDEREIELSAPDLETFPMLALARDAGERGGTYPCAYNAANEVAVAAFLAGRLPFLGIAEIVEETLAAVGGEPARTLDELVAADAGARQFAERTAERAAA